MGSDRLCLASSLEHEELRKDGNGFEEDGEGPEDFGYFEFVVEDEGEDDAWADEIFNFEGVDCRVVRWPVQ